LSKKGFTPSVSFSSSQLTPLSCKKLKLYTIS